MRIASTSRRTFIAGLIAAAGSLESGCRRREPLPDLGKLPAFSLTDQDGRPMGSKELAGRAWVASFFFTRCPTVCPRLMAKMKALQREAEHQGLPLHLVSISVDPDNDTPAVLKAYAQKLGAHLSDWSFLTGDAEAIKKASVDGFKLAVEINPDAGADHFGIVHGSHFVLVDEKLTVRGYYASLIEEDLAKLLGDAKTLG